MKAVMKCCVGLLLLAVFWRAHSADIQPPTRVTPYDWQCVDANSVKISDHQRVDLAIITCLNDPRGTYVQGGRYKINRPATVPPVTPPVVPTIPAQPPAELPAGRGTVTVTWTAVPDITQYTLCYGLREPLSKCLDVKASSTSYVVTGLGSASWLFAVRGVNFGVEGEAKMVGREVE